MCYLGLSDSDGCGWDDVYGGGGDTQNIYEIRELIISYHQFFLLLELGKTEKWLDQNDFS